MPKYKATAYIRLSYTDDHFSESDSVSNQRKLIENFVERNPDIEVVSEKIDDGYSGIIFDRPAFKEMMQDVTDGNIKADGKLKYQPGAIMTNLLLADEINRTSSKTQSALLEAMEELQVTVDGVTRPLPKPFVVLATENPVGSAGTQMLPASQLDRFLIRLSMGYPNRASTAALLKDRHHVDPLSACQTVTTPDELEKLIADVADIHVPAPGVPPRGRHPSDPLEAVLQAGRADPEGGQPAGEPLPPGVLG